jgi:hypothetical protein
VNECGLILRDGRSPLCVSGGKASLPSTNNH